ncbi:MAG: methyltransferase domain-containing protein [Alphaproteobacteria bacterium]|nr:methyltransferase domain-containing protein [Alphaproteobacteria bacterium]
MSEITADRQIALVWDYIKGFHAVHAIATGIETGLLERLATAGPTTAAALAAEKNLHPPYVAVWARTAVAYGLLDMDAAGTLVLAPFMKEVVASPQDPRYLGAYVMLVKRFMAGELERHPEFLKSGGTIPFQQHGRAFSAAIAATTGGLQAVLARKLLPGLPGMRAKLEAGARLLDVGCGTGGLMLTLAKAWPKLRCHGVEVDDHGLAEAHERIAAAGVDGRVTVERVGDDGPAESNAFDLAVMFEVLHEIPVAARPGVLTSTCRALKPGGALVILDETYPTDMAGLRSAEHALAVQTQYNEMVWGNVVPTAGEQEKLLADAGFETPNRSMLGGLFTVLLAEKPG